MRVIVDGRQGYAWAGSLDADVVAETLAEARDNAAFGAPDECVRPRRPRPTPRRSTRRRSTCGATTCSAVPTDRQGRARARARSARRAPATPRVRGVESASYGDAAMEAAVANSLGVEATARRTIVLVSRRSRSRARATATQTGYGFSAGRTVRRPRRRASRRATPPSARCGCSGATPAARRSGSPWSSTRWSRGRCSAILGAALSGEAVVKGRSMFVGREGEEVAAPRRHARRRPDRSPTRSARPPHDAEGVPDPPGRRSIVDGVLAAFLHNVYTGAPRRARRRRVPRCAAGTRRRPASAPGRSHSRPGALTPEEILASVPRGALRAVGERPALGHQPGERRLLGRCRGPDGARRRVRRARARGHDRVDAPAHAARRRRGRRATSPGSPAVPPA